MSASFILGWVLLVSSWVAPMFIKKEDSKSYTGLILAALALGAFAGDIVNSIAYFINK